MVVGSVTMGAAVGALGWLSEPWQLFVALVVMGMGWACLSLTAITSAILPWFPDRSAPAVTLALTGASVGGMLFVPGLVAVGQARGFTALTAVAAAAMLVVALPLAALVVRRPRSEARAIASPATRGDTVAGRAWSRREALRTGRFWTLSLSFGLALVVQVGFIVHHRAFLEPALGRLQAALAVSATTVSALLGRVIAGTLADRMDRRVLSAAMFAMQAAALAAMALSSSPAALFAASVVFGLNVGNIITLPPLITHAEFGARSFATVFGMTSAAIQLGVAAGPGLVGVLRDVTGGYPAPLGVLAVLDALAVVGVLWGRRAGAPFDSPTPTR
jgi:predicted MFS family arabinose efflux permease